MCEEKTHNSVRMNRDTELKKGFLEVMQNKILEDKRQEIRRWDFIPVRIKESM